MAIDVKTQELVVHIEAIVRKVFPGDYAKELLESERNGITLQETVIREVKEHSTFHEEGYWDDDDVKSAFSRVIFEWLNIKSKIVRT